jgi:AcrR family transcriptional regulator
MPKIVDHELQRELLLARCFTLFRKGNFASLSMRDIAREARVSTGSLYHYFPNRLVIIELLLGWVVRRDLERLELDGLSPHQRLQKLVRSLSGRGLSHQVLFQLALDLHRQSATTAQRLLQAFARSYEAGLQKALDITPRQAEALLTYLVGNVVRAVLVPAHYSFKANVRRLEEELPALLPALRSRRRPAAPRRTGQPRRRPSGGV